ncbi:MAG TPA: EVE domain-containing protein [Allosphingosinicella sp.]|nr:EVE domain-containing protein [Allosphingosinicella sp.]
MQRPQVKGARMAYWLMKSEAEVFSWDDLVRDGKTEWDGVRNYTARQNLAAMKLGDEAFFYHSNDQKAVVGIMRVSREGQPEGEDGKWVSVEMKPVGPVKRPVTLAEIKAEPKLAEMALVKLSRLSVGPVTAAEWKLVSKMAGL